MCNLIWFIVIIGYVINIVSAHVILAVYIPDLEQAYHDEVTSELGNFLIESDVLIGFISGIVPFITAFIFVPLIHIEYKLSKKRKVFKELCGD